MSSISPVGFNQDLTNLFSTNTNNSNNLLNVISGESTLTTISSMGQQINNLYSLVQSSGDKDVINGFKTAMLSMGNDIGNMRSVNFFNNMENMSYTDKKDFNKTFSTLNELNKNGLDGQVNHFIDTFNNAVDKFGTKNTGDFLDTTKSLIEKTANDDRLKANSTLSSYLDTYNSILNSTQSDKTEKENLAENFLKNIGEQETITAVNQYITEFKNNNNL
jgi:hypothetical protein